MRCQQQRLPWRLSVCLPSFALVLSAPRIQDSFKTGKYKKAWTESSFLTSLNMHGTLFLQGLLLVFLSVTGIWLQCKEVKPLRQWNIYKYEGINVTLFFFFHLCMNHFSDFCKSENCHLGEKGKEKGLWEPNSLSFFLLWRRLFQLCGALIGEQDREFVKTQHQHTDKHRDAVRLQMWQLTLFLSHVQTQTCCIKKDWKKQQYDSFQKCVGGANTADEVK